MQHLDRFGSNVAVGAVTPSSHPRSPMAVRRSWNGSEFGIQGQ
ncbi:hypothetical protein L838_2848 [Mycobacterium avium MAV_120709_2344]|nr:hypothetical protein L838_2848 [Mycobacterium avium MAV_120709_2344]